MIFVKNHIFLYFNCTTQYIIRRGFKKTHTTTKLLYVLKGLGIQLYYYNITMYRKTQQEGENLLNDSRLTDYREEVDFL